MVLNIVDIGVSAKNRKNVPGDPKKGIPLFEIFWEAWVLTKLPTKLIFRFLIKSLAYFDKYFQRFF